MREGGSVPISDERYPAVGSDTRCHQVDTQGRKPSCSSPHHWVLALLSILIVSCGASLDLGFGIWVQ